MYEGTENLALKSLSFFGPELEPWEEAMYEINIELVETYRGQNTTLATYLPPQQHEVVAWYNEPMLIDLGEIALPAKTWVDIRFQLNVSLKNQDKFI